ncbi:MAG: polysaccharide biosynthesis C-terminal domain-containing protein [Clostridia bacterium]|nr:polysaccharide biosynthesis C-terminal domain-containing protein [Clostridia bacterium]
MSNSNTHKISQVKYGAILSYVLIALNAVYGIAMAPYILSQIGESNYGVYKTIASFSSTIMVLDLGIGTTVMRYTAKFRAEQKEDEISNFAAMGLIEAGVMASIVTCVCVVIYNLLPTFYADSFTIEEINLTQTLFLILSINMVLVIIENVLNGVITGTDHFVFANGTKLTLLVLRIFASIALLQKWKSAVVLVLITLAVSVITMILQLWFIYGKLKIRIRLKRWDFSLFKESMGYTAAMFIQTLVVQANGNVDNIVVSHVIGPAAVAVYSIGIQLFNMYESLAMAFSNLMLPPVSKQISEGASDEELQQTVTKIGRMQFVVLGAALAGFICVGNDFIYLWLGEGFEDAYYLSLILMTPAIFTLIQNVCLSILRARNMMKFRTWSLVFGLVFNIAFTVVGTRLWGYYAAAMGTAISVLFGYVIAMNIYYHKRIGFKVFRFYFDVFRRLLVCVLVPASFTWLLNYIADSSWMWLLIRVAVFMVIYAAMLWFYGLTKQEKRYFWKR